MAWRALVLARTGGYVVVNVREGFLPLHYYGQKEAIFQVSIPKFFLRFFRAREMLS